MPRLAKVVPVRRTVGRAPQFTPERDDRIALAHLRLNLVMRAAMIKPTTGQKS